MEKKLIDIFFRYFLFHWFENFEDILQDFLYCNEYDEITCYLRSLHEMVMSGISDFGKEENMLFLISALIQKYGQLFESCILECPQEIEKACEFMPMALS